MAVLEVNHRTTTVSKALIFLKLYFKQESVGLWDVEQAIGYSKTAAFALASTLVDGGFLTKDAESKRYYLGPVLFQLARMYQNKDISNVAHPFLEELVDLLGETVMITARTKHKVIILDFVESPQLLKWTAGVDESTDYMYAGTSKVHLAYLSPADLKLYLKKNELIVLSPNTTTDPDLLQEELSRIRKNGYVLSEGEVDAELVGVSAPVWGRGREPLIALRVAGPRTRITPDKYNEYTKLVVEYANKISAALLGEQ